MQGESIKKDVDSNTEVGHCQQDKCRPMQANRESRFLPCLPPPKIQAGPVAVGDLGTVSSDTYQSNVFSGSTVFN